MSGFRHLGDELIHDGYVIRLYNSSFEAPDGTEFQRDVVRHPGAVSIVPVHANGDVVLVSQFRAPLDSFAIEIPAGKRDVADEPLEVTAARELEEEVGLVAGKLEQLVRFHNSIGFCDEESHVFLATELSSTALDRQGLEEEFMEILTIPLQEAIGMIASGKITDAKTIIGLTLAAGRLSTS